MKKILLTYILFFSILSVFSQAKIYTLKNKPITVDSIYSENNEILVYEKNKSLHDLYTKEIKRIEYKNTVIYYINGIKQSAENNVKDSASPSLKNNRPIKKQTQEVEKQMNSYSISKYNFNSTISEFFNQYKVIMLGVEYNINHKYSLGHSVGIATSDNGISFNEDEDVFHSGGIVNRTEMRNYLVNKPAPYSKKINRLFIGFDFKHRYGYQSVTNYQNAKATYSVNKIGLHLKTGIQRVETQNAFLEFSIGLGLNFIWGEKRYSVNGSQYQPSDMQFTKEINDVKPTLVIGLKLGFGNFK